MTATKSEIYVRFESDKHGIGMFESPCNSIEEAAGQFAEDHDSVSATAHEFDAAGRMIMAVDVTEQVIDHLRGMIRDDTWTTSPHPMLNNYFSAWSEEVERDRAQNLEHERVESAMLNI
jgi:hypothetical protein